MPQSAQVQTRTVTKLAVGHDHGNTGTTVYTIEAPEIPRGIQNVTTIPMGRIQQITFPSAVAEGSMEELQSLRAGTGRANAQKEEDGVISVDGGPEYFVGKLAQTQARSASTGRGDIHRYENQRSLIALLYGLGKLTKQDIEAWVVTGLPVETFKKGKAIRRGAKDILEGKHRFTLNRGEERYATIYVVNVLMEGAGGLIAQGLDGDDVRQSILDIGGRTTDGVGCAGQDPILHLCGGTPRGVEDSKAMLSRFVESDKRFKRALNPVETESVLRTHIRIKAALSILAAKKYDRTLSDLSESQISEILHDQQTLYARQLAEKYRITSQDITLAANKSLLKDLSLQDLEIRYRTLHARSQEIGYADLFNWTEQSLRSVGKDIASFASQLWRVDESGEVATDNALVLGSGGGAYYYLEDIVDIIPDIKACNDPELANAAGYANFAYSAVLEIMGIMV